MQRRKPLCRPFNSLYRSLHGLSRSSRSALQSSQTAYEEDRTALSRPEMQMAKKLRSCSQGMAVKMQNHSHRHMSMLL